MLKIPSFTDALPLTLGEKLPTPNSIKPSEEWDLIRHDARGALWKNCAGGRLQFIPDPATLGPRKPPVQTPKRLQKALDSTGEAFKPLLNKFKGYNFARYIDPDLHATYGIRAIVQVLLGRVYFDPPGAYGMADKLFPCDAEGWIPYDPDRFPGVMNIEWRATSGVCGRWLMLPHVDAAKWAGQASVNLSSWKPLL